MAILSSFESVIPKRFSICSIERLPKRIPILLISYVEPACGGDPEVAYLAYAFPYRNRHRDTGNGLYTVPIYLSHLRASEYISAVYYLLIVCFLFHLSIGPVTVSASPLSCIRLLCLFLLRMDRLHFCLPHTLATTSKNFFFKVCIRSSQSFHYICITLVLQRYNGLSYLQ